MAALLLLNLLLCCVLPWASQCATLSSRLIHRFSNDVMGATASRGAVNGSWPSKGSAEYYMALMGSDLLRLQRRGLGSKYQMLYPSRGSDTVSLGNNFGWLHYTWIDIGTPNVSFLVALDAGSDLSWVPCDCIKCAPLSSRDNGLDKDLNMYNPTESRTSKHLSCSHELCDLGPSCESSKQPCPYNITYYSEDTSSSGYLVEDTVYLASSENHTIVQSPIVIGCGRRQSGGLDGIAPDGLLGLGFGDISVPTFLARDGLVPNSFSLCFRDDDSGRIFFGDQGISNQQSTPFVALDGKYVTYIVQVEMFCVGVQCLDQTRIQALVDSGSSFTYLPDGVYKKVTSEFHKLMNKSRFSYDGSPWEYCYKASSLEMPDIPQVTLMLSVNKSFVINNPVFHYYGKEGELDVFCLALQSSDGNFGTIGQNLMAGYRMVFDREKLRLGWSPSDCNDLGSSRRMPLTPPPYDRPENPLPTNQQQSSPNAHPVSPAEAGRAPTNSSEASHHSHHFVFLTLLLLLISFSVILGG